MKSFVWFESATAIKGNHSFKVYEIKENKLHLLGEWKIRYWMTVWAESELMLWLINNWNLPKSITKDSKYYTPDNENFELTYILPDNQESKISF
jgi:hypothetical protein